MRLQALIRLLQVVAVGMSCAANAQIQSISDPARNLRGNIEVAPEPEPSVNSPSSSRLQLFRCQLASTAPIVRKAEPRQAILPTIRTQPTGDRPQKRNPATDSQGPATADELVVTGPRSRLRTNESLDKRLERCIYLRDQISWQEPGGETLRYTDWPVNKKARLNELFQRFLEDSRDLGINCPEAARAVVQPSYDFYYDYEEAFDIFAAHVAHSLHLEAQNLVPWKLHQMGSEEVAQIVASRNYFSIIRPSTKTDYPPHITAGEDYQPLGWSQRYGPMLCDPRKAYEAFKEKAYGGPQFSEVVFNPDLETTLARLTLWFRDFVHHGIGETVHFSDLPMSFVHNYMTVASRFLARQYQDSVKIVAYDGCHQAAGLFREIARSLNIPLLLVASQDFPTRPGIPFPSRTHKGLCWRWSQPDGRCLWHMDEVYAMGLDEPTFPIDDFGQALPPNAAALNYFRSHWVPLAELPDWGFEVIMADTIPNPQTGHLFYSNKGSAEEYFNYGTFLGYWHLSDRAQALWDQSDGQQASIEFLDLSRYLRFVNLIRTGSWYFNSDPCTNTPQILEVDFDYRMAGLRAAEPPPVIYTKELLEERMRTNVKAYGDQWGNCPHMSATKATFANMRDSLQ